jgi:hypothetical protein
VICPVEWNERRRGKKDNFVKKKEKKITNRVESSLWPIVTLAPTPRTAHARELRAGTSAPAPGLPPGMRLCACRGRASALGHASTPAPPRTCLRSWVGTSMPRAKARRRVVVAENLLVSLAAADWGLEHRSDLRAECGR